MDVVNADACIAAGRFDMRVGRTRVLTGISYEPIATREALGAAASSRHRQCSATQRLIYAAAWLGPLRGSASAVSANERAAGLLLELYTEYSVMGASAALVREKMLAHDTFKDKPQDVPRPDEIDRWWKRQYNSELQQGGEEGAAIAEAHRHASADRPQRGPRHGSGLRRRQPLVRHQRAGPQQPTEATEEPD